MAGNEIASLKRRGWPAVAGLTWLCALAVCSAAEEPVYRQQVRSLVPDLSKPGGDKDSTKSFDFLAPNSSLGPMIDAPIIAPPTQPRMPLSREKQETLDRKKNWIFVTPENSNETPEALLGVKKQTDLAGEKEFKGVMQSYLEKKDGKTDKSDNKDDKEAASRTNNAAGKTRDELNPGPDDRFGLKSDALPMPWDRDDKRGKKDLKDKDDAKEGTKEQSGLPSILSRAAGESPVGGVPSPFELDRPSYLSSGNFAPSRKTEEQKAKDIEFKQLLEGRPVLSEQRSGIGDPINAFNDATRQPINPVTSQPGELARPLETRSSLDSINRPGAFDTVHRPAGLPELNTRMLGSSSLSPAVVAPPQPVFAQPKPIVLEIPRRKF